jgi:hypothetical protein
MMHSFIFLCLLRLIINNQIVKNLIHLEKGNKKGVSNIMLFFGVGPHCFTLVLKFFSKNAILVDIPSTVTFILLFFSKIQFIQLPHASHRDTGFL